MCDSTVFRARSLIVLLGVVLLAVAGACEPQATEAPGTEAGDEGAEVEVEPAVVEQGAGTFELILAGDLEKVHGGTASCVIDATDGSLRVSLDPRGPSDHRFYVLVPEYDDSTGRYDGELQVSGAERSVGPVDVAIARERGEDELFEPQLTVSFEGTYTGAAGTGTAEGEAICSLPDGEEPMMDAEPEVEDEP